MRSTCVAIPGAFNALAALAIAKHGFEACYISGAATSVSAGVPDVGLLTHEHFAKCIREAYDASGLPIIADADTGFGEAEMLRRVVIDYAKAGAAGLHIEDQKFPKRCGHLDGKELVPVDHMVEKVQWAVKAAKQLPGSDAEAAFIVCARTDARGVEGFDAAVKRAAAYVQAGAEMIFPEGLTSEQEFSDFAKQLRAACPGREVFMLANMTEFGKTPITPIARFQELGYNCVIYPVSLLRIAMGAVDKALAAMKRDGSVSGVIDQMQTRKELYELIAYTPGVPWEYRQRD
jgi:methylisocitrate lyase